MSKKKKELQINYLDLIPERSAQLRWHTDIRGRMVLEIENKGAFNTIDRKSTRLNSSHSAKSRMPSSA